MSMNLKGWDFLKLLDFTPEEIEYLIDLAADLKAKKAAGIPHKLCKGKKEKGGRDFSLPPEVHRSMPTARCFFACCTAFSALRRRLKSSRSRVFS